MMRPIRNIVVEKSRLSAEVFKKAPAFYIDRSSRRLLSHSEKSEQQFWLSYGHKTLEVPWVKVEEGT